MKRLIKVCGAKRKLIGLTQKESLLHFEGNAQYADDRLLKKKNQDIKQIKNLEEDHLKDE